MGETLNLTRDGPVATVTMARPEVHNAFNEHLIVGRSMVRNTHFGVFRM